MGVGLDGGGGTSLLNSRILANLRAQCMNFSPFGPPLSPVPRAAAPLATPLGGFLELMLVFLLPAPLYPYSSSYGLLQILENNKSCRPTGISLFPQFNNYYHYNFYLFIFESLISMICSFYVICL